MIMVGEEYVTVAQAAQLFSISRSTLWRWIDQGRLPAYRLGQRRVLIRQDDLKTLITPARAEGRRGMTEIEKERERLSRPLTVEERRKALVALEAAERFSAELRRRRGGELFSDSAEIVREMREERARELS
ncbi:MAG: helix-turn-helix domain-containing protein [Chloroflexi bacterium]|nr:helix-turn-helix domain-containing protein [Chloroflexota bacterium]